MTFLDRHTLSTSRIHNQSQQLWIPSVHGASWTVPVTDKWAVDCSDRPCDCSWHRTRNTSGQPRGRRNLPNPIGHRRCHTCNSHCWSICHTAWKLVLRHEMQETEDFFVRVCASMCEPCQQCRSECAFQGCARWGTWLWYESTNITWSQLAHCSLYGMNAC